MSDTPTRAYTSRQGLLDLSAPLTNIPMPTARGPEGETVDILALINQLDAVGQCYVFPLVGGAVNAEGAHRRVSEVVVRQHRLDPTRRFTCRRLRGLDNKGDKVTHIGIWRIK